MYRCFGNLQEYCIEVLLDSILVQLAKSEMSDVFILAICTILFMAKRTSKNSSKICTLSSPTFFLHNRLMSSSKAGLCSTSKTDLPVRLCYTTTLNLSIMFNSFY